MLITSTGYGQVLIWPRRVEVIPHPKPAAAHPQPSAGALWYLNSVPMWYS
jgi:hypothetical protein